MFHVYQINLTDELYNEINTNPSSEKALAYSRGMIGDIDKAIDLELFEHVANVDTDNVEEAFVIMNRRSDEDEVKVDRFRQLCSLSVGNVLINTSELTMHVCKTIGWEEKTEKERKYFESKTSTFIRNHLA